MNAVPNYSHIVYVSDMAMTYATKDGGLTWGQVYTNKIDEINEFATSQAKVVTNFVETLRVGFYKEPKNLLLNSYYNKWIYIGAEAYKNRTH